MLPDASVYGYDNYSYHDMVTTCVITIITTCQTMPIWLSDRFNLRDRHVNLSWNHHKAVASIKKTKVVNEKMQLELP